MAIVVISHTATEALEQFSARNKETRHRDAYHNSAERVVCRQFRSGRHGDIGCRAFRV